jgi:hypothetical protein
MEGGAGSERQPMEPCGYRPIEPPQEADGGPQSLDPQGRNHNYDAQPGYSVGRHH